MKNKGENKGDECFVGKREEKGEEKVRTKVKNKGENKGDECLGGKREGKGEDNSEDKSRT